MKKDQQEHETKKNKNKLLRQASICTAFLASLRFVTMASITKSNRFHSAFKCFP